MEREKGLDSLKLVTYSLHCDTSMKLGEEESCNPLVSKLGRRWNSHHHFCHSFAYLHFEPNFRPIFHLKISFSSMPFFVQSEEKIRDCELKVELNSELQPSNMIRAFSKKNRLLCPLSQKSVEFETLRRAS